MNLFRTDLVVVVVHYVCHQTDKMVRYAPTTTTHCEEPLISSMLLFYCQCAVIDISPIHHQRGTMSTTMYAQKSIAVIE